MKSKIPITKSIALVLCIVTVILSWNMYSSFKDLYFEEESYKDSITYTAFANNSLNDSNISFSTNVLPLPVFPKIENNKENEQKKIFINIILLFLSFISLASIHNFILKIETAKWYDFINISNKVKNKNPNISLTSSLVSEEGVK